MSNWDDKKIQKLADDTVLLQSKLEEHIDDFNDHVKSENEKWEEFLEIQKGNTLAVKDLAEKQKS